LTAIAAIVLVAIGLAVISRPLFARSTRRRLEGVESRLAEVEERYRSALADIQDAQNDWEIGNLSEADYARFRYDGRRRAAEALREIAAFTERRAHIRREVERELAAMGRPTGVASAVVDHANGRVPAASPRTTAASQRGGIVYAVGGAAGVAAAIAGIVFIYAHARSIQAAQAPVGALPGLQVHAVVTDARGGFWVATQNGLLRSDDGRAWRPGGAAADISGIATRDGAPWLAVGRDVSLESDDGGATWVEITTDLPDGGIAGAGSGMDGAFAYVAGAGLYRTDDGAHWMLVAAPVNDPVTGLAILPGSQGGQAIYLAAGRSVIRSGDGGRTWASAAGAVNLAVTGVVRGVSADATRGALYAASSDGIFRTTRDGSEWEKLPFQGSVRAVAGRGDRLVAIDDDGHVFVSNSGGAAWTADQG